MEYHTKRTTANDKDFQLLVKKLDHELWNELAEDQATYDQYNKVPDIPTALVAYYGSQPVACGCFKAYDGQTVEIKRMFVQKEHRGKGLSKKILSELEGWAIENNFQFAVLETSVHFATARNLYTSNGYSTIPNYGPYTDLPESICMKKTLQL
jgi:GNAT superfamily N-acetyltransferase